jgi:hypothetical protein
MTGKARTCRPVALRGAAIAVLIAAALTFVAGAASAEPRQWRYEWPNTDFSRHNVPLAEIFSGGVPKDGIPPIDDPAFAPIDAVAKLYVGTEPVITVAIGGKARAYPLGILMTHEIVNDTLAGRPIAVTYCPLCNAAIVVDRVVDGREYTFGVSGKLRNSDLVMWDRQTESWWQQFTGIGIVGEMTGTELTMVRVESFERFATRFPDGEVLLSPRGGPGVNPYADYDSAPKPFLYRGSFPEGIRPLEYVVAVGDRAWALPLLKRRRVIVNGDLVLTWEPGQNAAMDRMDISKGRDIGNVLVQRKVDGKRVDVVHDVTFAFAFHAFNPGGTIRK